MSSREENPNNPVRGAADPENTTTRVRRENLFATLCHTHTNTQTAQLSLHAVCFNVHKFICPMLTTIITFPPGKTKLATSLVPTESLWHFPINTGAWCVCFLRAKELVERHGQQCKNKSPVRHVVVSELSRWKSCGGVAEGTLLPVHLLSWPCALSHPGRRAVRYYAKQTFAVSWRQSWWLD